MAGLQPLAPSQTPAPGVTPHAPVALPIPNAVLWSPPLPTIAPSGNPDNVQLTQPYEQPDPLQALFQSAGSVGASPANGGKPATGISVGPGATGQAGSANSLHRLAGQQSPTAQTAAAGTVAALAPRVLAPSAAGGAFAEGAGGAALSGAASLAPTIGFPAAIGLMGADLAHTMSRQQYANAAAGDPPQTWTDRGLSADQWRQHVQTAAQTGTDPYDLGFARRQARDMSSAASGALAPGTGSATPMMADTSVDSTTAFPADDGLAIPNQTGHPAPQIVGIDIFATPISDGLQLPNHSGHSSTPVTSSPVTSYPIGEQPQAPDLALAKKATYVRGSDFPDDSVKLNATNTGPGQWVYVPSRSMSDRAAAYQEQISGSGSSFANEYNVDGKNFDGVRTNADGSTTLLEAKGEGFADRLKPNGEPEGWFRRGFDEQVSGIQDEAKIAAKHGATLEVHVAENSNADALQTALRDRGAANVQVIFTPPQ